MKKKICLFAIMALTFLSASLTFAQSTSGKVGFLKAPSPSNQEKAACDFFIKTYGEDNVITSDESISAYDYDCIWIHIDRTGYDYNNLPEIFKSDKIAQFVIDGGSLYLSAHATNLLAPMGRIDAKYSPNIIGSGDGGDGRDEWNVNANFAGQDFRSIPFIIRFQQTHRRGTRHSGCFTAEEKPK